MMSNISEHYDNAVDVELSEGQVTSAAESSHAVENIGDTEVETVQVELKV